MYVPRPKGLTAICVIGFVLAGLGFVGLSMGVFWWVMGDQWMEFWMGMGGGMPQQQMDLQRELMEEIGAVQEKWVPFTVAQSILQAVLVVLLFVASFKGIKMREGAGKLLAIAMAFAILFELGRAYPNFAIQRESQQISMEFQNKLMQTGGNPAQTRAALSIVKRVQELTLAFTYVLIGGWLLAKLSFYGYALWYVRRPHIRALFKPPDPADPATG